MPFKTYLRNVPVLVRPTNEKCKKLNKKDLRENRMMN